MKNVSRLLLCPEYVVVCLLCLFVVVVVVVVVAGWVGVEGGAVSIGLQGKNKLFILIKC